ncbi:MAG: hypothetical protein ACOH5I_08765 [Oligoflexus sp.]
MISNFFAVWTITCLVFFLGCNNEETVTTDDKSSNLPKTPVAHDQSCNQANQTINSISESVALINRLPKPVTLPCFLSSLQRPLSIIATDSELSVQPAISRSQPRIFLVSASLIFSVVPGDPILEFGEIFDDQMSIKGEIVFPLTEEIAENLPFVNTGAIFNDAKRCGNACHPSIVELENIGGEIKYASQMVRPNPDSIIPLEELEQYSENCLDSNEQACQLYQSIFTHGELIPYEFDESLPFF